MLKRPVVNPYFNLHVPRRPRLSSRKRLCLALFLGLVAYLIGFALFIVSMPTPFATLPENLEGLAVFTGGAGRVDAALNAASNGYTGPLLISGGHPQTRLRDVLTLTESKPVLTAAQQKRIMLDNAATTRQNVKSLKVWAGLQHLTHIGVIISTYHAARVRLLIRWHAPELQATVLAVQPVNPSLMPLFHEYNKLLVAPFLR